MSTSVSQRNADIIPSAVLPIKAECRDMLLPTKPVSSRPAKRLKQHIYCSICLYSRRALGHFPSAVNSLSRYAFSSKPNLRTGIAQQAHVPGMLLRSLIQPTSLPADQRRTPRHHCLTSNCLLSQSEHSLPLELTTTDCAM